MKTGRKFAGAAQMAAGAALWFSAGNLLVAPVAAQCINPVQVPNQTIGSGTWTFSDSNALAASNVVIHGSASVTFRAGNCIHLQPGFRATAGTAGTTFNARVERAPMAELGVPRRGRGRGTRVHWEARTPAG